MSERNGHNESGWRSWVAPIVISTAVLTTLSLLELASRPLAFVVAAIVVIGGAFVLRGGRR